LLIAPLLAAALVAVGQALGWRGVDLPAQVYRVQSFQAHGWAIWDTQWFGGHWTLDYSVIFPPVAAAIGLRAAAVISAALAALAFDRLAWAHFGRPGRAASLVFAAGTAVTFAIGQLPFLTGEALGLAACWAALRNRWVVAAALAFGASLSSPLAGMFVVLAFAAWGVTRWRAGGFDGFSVRAALVMAAAGAPVAAAAALFPGSGVMPYPVVDYLWELAVAALLWALAGREPVIRVGAAGFAAAATLLVAVPTAVGGNIGRIEDVLALPLATALLWHRARLLLPVAAVPLALSQWGPAWGAMTSNDSQPSAHAAYYTPLVTALRHLSAGGPAGRIEVVPTEFHWETAYVAPAFPLARGWERQLDVADDSLFYGPADRLTPSAYRAFLLDNGVRFVALADAPLDFAGQAEGRLVASGRVPGLSLVWHSADWRVYAVAGSSGIVQAPARLVSAAGDRVVVQATRPGPVLIRVRYNDDWGLDEGTGCVTRSGPWLTVDVPRAERFTVRLALLGSDPDCAGAPQEARAGGAARGPAPARATG
jgi:hypothetical protein